MACGAAIPKAADNMFGRLTIGVTSFRIVEFRQTRELASRRGEQPAHGGDGLVQGWLGNAEGRTMKFQAYHGVTAAEHQSKFNALSTDGYRMISLSVYGDPADARYAAVWVQRGGPAWVAVHGVNAAGYQSFFNTQTAQGFVPVLVSATGPVGNAVFAAMFEKSIAGPWLARHGMTFGPQANAGTFDNLNALARSQGLAMRSVAIYGTAQDRRYAAIWHANPGFVKWHVHEADSTEGYQTTFNAETQLPGIALHGYRPAYVTLSTDHLYCSVFKDDVVGPWVARHGMTSAEYQAEFNAQLAAGKYPICVQGGGVGNDTRYAALFAGQDIPEARAFHATGAAVPAAPAFDHLLQTFMQANAVRAAQLAIGKNGVIKLARAYTWAEQGYHVTQPSDVFLLASCSKMFLEAAVQSLYDAGKLTPSTKVYPLLGFSHPADPRSDTITIQQLLDHEGGYDDRPVSQGGSGFDPTYAMRDIALNQHLGHPVGKLDVARYMYARPLDFAPGTPPSRYSNYGYLLASAVVEKVTGQDYFTYLKQAVLNPLGITEVIVSSTRAEQRAANEAICEDEGLGLSPLELTSNLLVPAVYGGDGQIKDVAAGCAGLAASATAMVQFIHKNLVWGNGPRPANGGNWGLARTGSTPGTSTEAKSSGDGFDWAFVINTRDFPPNTSQTLDGLAQAIDQLISTSTFS
jgi:CubicO group peptidase (beta-lactamase class C family)